MSLELEKIIIKVKIVEEKKLKAIIGLDFGNFVIKGFRICESTYPNYKGDKLWLLPPSYQGGGRYHPMFYVTDKGLWEKLATLIWEEYYKQEKNHYSKRLGIDPKVMGF